MDKNIKYIFFNGLSKGNIQFHERWVIKWWSRKGIELEHRQINWHDDKTLDEMMDDLSKKIKKLAAENKGVVLVGSSASGSLVMNLLQKVNLPNVLAVNAHGRLRSGNFKDDDKNSLYRRAGMATENEKSPKFFDSVMLFEKNQKKLTKEQKSRILNLTQLTDLVVPTETMQLDGVKTHRSKAFGHSGGFLAHLIADRDLIVSFAEEKMK